MECEGYTVTENGNQELTPGSVSAQPAPFATIGFNDLGPVLVDISENNLSQQIQE